jgi:histidyl-tRNA synthetase
MTIPTFEDPRIYERGLGAGSDVVAKELFSVSTRDGGEAPWALRPEATAGVVRAYLQNGLRTLPAPLRLMVLGPMFRADRPQAGRFREFWQWSLEVFGAPAGLGDAELVAAGARFFARAGLSDVVVRLNSIGCAVCRPGYLEKLRAYFAPYAAGLSGSEQARLAANPLRLLDSKDLELADLLKAAPRIIDSLCGPCADQFALVVSALESLGIATQLDPMLVRGLDYYNGLVFEYWREGEESSQGALGGGGRYDGLVATLGGPPTTAIGLAIGLDRTAAALGEGLSLSAIRPVAVVGVSPDDRDKRLKIAESLRDAGLIVLTQLGEGNISRQLSRAQTAQARYAVIVGDELARGLVGLKDLDAGSQEEVSLADLVSALR